MESYQSGENVVTVKSERSPGLFAKFLLISDLHWDSPFCNRKLLAKHMQQAVDENAGILIGGDLFDAMQSREDRRGDKDGLRPEFVGGNYLDLLVDGATAWFAPYAKNIVMISDGNHDSAIRKHLETDLLARLCEKLNVVHMPYACFVDFSFSRQGGGRRSFDLYMHHGYGGGGAVTKGMIGNARRAQNINADIFLSGHVHELVSMVNMRTELVRVGNRRVTRDRPELHLISAGYKNEEAVGSGYHVEKGRSSKPLGGWWLSFRQDGDDVSFGHSST